MARLDSGFRRNDDVRELVQYALCRALFAPRRIALIGASSDAARLTARPQIYLRRHGFTGALYPVNPRASEVLGERAYASLHEVPD